MARPIGRGPVDMPTRVRIAGWLRHEMDRRHISSIREMARLIGVSHAYLSRILSGETTPGLELVLRTTRVLHLSADVILNIDPPPPSPPE